MAAYNYKYTCTQVVVHSQLHYICLEANKMMSSFLTSRLGAYKLFEAEVNFQCNIFNVHCMQAAVLYCGKQDQESD